MYAGRFSWTVGAVFWKNWGFTGKVDLGTVTTESIGNEQCLEVSGFEESECVDSLAPFLSQEVLVTRNRRHTEILSSGNSNWCKGIDIHTSYTGEFFFFFLSFQLHIRIH